MPEFTDALTFASTAALQAAVGVTGSWASFATFTVSGLQVIRDPENHLYYVNRYLGEPNIPSDVRRLRRSVLEVMRRMGQPVIVKHMFTDADVKLGLATRSPSFDDVYGQVRNKDPYSYGTGFCSTQTSLNEWINPNTGEIVRADTQPDLTWQAAPMYRGYGPGFLAYLIEPDVPLDIFKLAGTGALTKVQSQTVVAAWWPEINDNDLVINVELNEHGRVEHTNERYQVKKSLPISIRGLDRKGRREYSADHGNRHVVNQQFEMSTIQPTSVLNAVETDR